MAAKGSTLVTLADVAKNKNKEIGQVAEVLVESNPMLEDIGYKEMNEGTTHKESIRSALPAVYYRKANQPIPASKTGIEERSFTATRFDSKSQLDKIVAERGGKENVGYNRWNEAQAHLQAHANELGSLLIYGSPVASNMKTAGLFDIYSTVSASEETSKQIIDAGGTGSDNCSILKVHWGEQSLFGVYPKGTKSGISRMDHSTGGKLVQIPGLDENGNSGNLWGYEEEFVTEHGLVVKDYRQAARIANIDVSDLKTGSAADLIDLMISANFCIDSLNNGKGCWYVNRTIAAFLYKQARTGVSAGGGLNFANFDGKEVLTFMGDPVRVTDSLLTSEARVV